MKQNYEPLEDEIDETCNWPMIIGAVLLMCGVGALAIFGGS